MDNMNSTKLSDSLTYVQEIEIIPMYEDTKISDKEEYRIYKDIIEPLLFLLRKNIEFNKNRYKGRDADIKMDYFVSDEFLKDQIRLTLLGVNLKLVFKMHGSISIAECHNKVHVIKDHLGLKNSLIMVQGHDRNLLPLVEIDRVTPLDNNEVKLTVTEIIFNKETGIVYVNNKSNTLLRIQPDKLSKQIQSTLILNSEDDFIDVNYSRINTTLKNG